MKVLQEYVMYKSPCMTENRILRFHREKMHIFTLQSFQSFLQMGLYSTKNNKYNIRVIGDSLSDVLINIIYIVI